MRLKDTEIEIKYDSDWFFGGFSFKAIDGKDKNLVNKFLIEKR